MCMCMCMCVFVWMSACAHAYVYACAFAYACVCACVCVCMCVRVCTFLGLTRGNFQQIREVLLPESFRDGGHESVVAAAFAMLRQTLHRQDFQCATELQHLVQRGGCLTGSQIGDHIRHRGNNVSEFLFFGFKHIPDQLDPVLRFRYNCCVCRCAIACAGVCEGAR